MIFVAVVGDGRCSPEVAAEAEKVGMLLAQRGCVVVCGGLGGVMEAACRGAKGAGGTSIGILPGDNRTAANAYVDIPIVTGLGEARNVLVVKNAQAVIAVGGMYGTLSEIALALKLGVPVVGLRSWELAKDGSVDSGIVPVDTPEDAVAAAVAMAMGSLEQPAE